MILLPFYSHSTDDSMPILLAFYWWFYSHSTRILLRIVLPFYSHSTDDSTPILRICNWELLSFYCWFYSLSTDCTFILMVIRSPFYWFPIYVSFYFHSTDHSTQNLLTIYLHATDDSTSILPKQTYIHIWPAPASFVCKSPRKAHNVHTHVRNAVPLVWGSQLNMLPNLIEPLRSVDECNISSGWFNRQFANNNMVPLPFWSFYWAFYYQSTDDFYSYSSSHQ